MQNLGIEHYSYIMIIAIILILLIFKKDIVFPSAIGLLIMGVLHTRNVLAGIQTIYKGVLVSGNEFWSIIVIISFIYAMSLSLHDINGDKIMLKPLSTLIKSKESAFWILGLSMMVVSFGMWPSPSVGLIGAILLPISIKAGLPPVWAASVINIFGHGIALSGDFIIQGAPGITSSVAGIEDTAKFIRTSLPLWGIMSVTTIILLFVFMKKDVGKSSRGFKAEEKDQEREEINIFSRIIAIITPLGFILDILIMYRYSLKGGDAAALISGTAIIITSLACFLKKRNLSFLEDIAAFIKEGFLFGIKTFSPVLITAAFFFLGNEDTSKLILGESATGYLKDISIYISQRIQLSRVPVIIMQSVSAGLAGLGGAGFSALPLVGTLADSFGDFVSIDKAKLAALGQVTAMWVGGGTIIPWGVIPAAAICNVEPIDLVRKNFFPVLIGLIVTTIFAFFYV